MFKKKEEKHTTKPVILRTKQNEKSYIKNIDKTRLNWEEEDELRFNIGQKRQANNDQKADKDNQQITQNQELTM